MLKRGACQLRGFLTPSSVGTSGADGGTWRADVYFYVYFYTLRAGPDAATRKLVAAR